MKGLALFAPGRATITSSSWNVVTHFRWWRRNWYPLSYFQYIRHTAKALNTNKYISYFWGGLLLIDMYGKIIHQQRFTVTILMYSGKFEWAEMLKTGGGVGGIQMFSFLQIHHFLSAFFRIFCLKFKHPLSLFIRNDGQTSKNIKNHVMFFHYYLLSTLFLG